MNIGDFNIKVRKIVNGYVVSYPVPKPKPKKGKEAKPYVEEEQQAAMRFFSPFIVTSDSPMETAEWYCPTKAALEEALPRLVMECYHAAVTLKDEV